MTFDQFQLRLEILRAVADAGYTVPTPIQEQAIPTILAGSDLLGIAQTGTGKTAAFVLPMIERLASGRARARMPRSLIVSPTRELATQTADYFETYGKYLQLQMALLIGGVGMDEQWRRLERGVDVLIVTPGRLLDQFERGKLLLTGVEFLVIDEADRMLDMGFMPDVERIVNLVSKRRQTLMFSATMPKEIRRLASQFLNDPKEVQATPPATHVERIEDHVSVVPPRQKFKALRHLIESQGVGKAIIFCNRKREVASLRRQLEKVGLNVRDIHGDLDQSQRLDALAAFKRGDIDFLVATDVAARGLDIAALPCVINYDVPTHADDYVHRIGRTGRAGQDGRAFTLVFADEGKYVDAITKLTGKTIPRLEIAGMADGAPPPTLTHGRRGAAAAGGDRRAEGRAARRPSSPATESPSTPTEAPEVDRQPKERATRRGSAPATEASSLPIEAPPPKEPAPAPIESAPASRRPARSRRPAAVSEPARNHPRRDDRPIVGMGDHVPLFLLRPVPGLEGLGNASED
jgi:superfamily II DNA/RNA helicase